MLQMPVPALSSVTSERSSLPSLHKDAEELSRERAGLTGMSGSSDQHNHLPGQSRVQLRVVYWMFSSSSGWRNLSVSESPTTGETLSLPQSEDGR